MANEGAEAMIQGDNVARTKIEIEVESHVLGSKVKLSDGTEGNVFTRTPRNKDLQFVYSCHICGVPTLCGERMLQIHIAGRRHQARLSVPKIDAEQYRASLVMKPKQNPASSAGDGMAGSGTSDPQGLESKSVAQLQSVLDGYRAGPLVGLEYIVELKHQGPGEGVSYNCLLCDTRGNNESGITTHLIMPDHRLKFLEKHYATVMKVIAPYRSAPGADAKDSVFCRVVQTICEAIEDHHGRMAPSVYDADDFGRNRAKYIQSVKFGKHCDEQTGPKFVELIDKKVLQDLKATTADGASGGGGGGGGTAGQRKYRNRNERRGSLDSISSLSSANSVMSISSSGDNDDESRLRKKSPLNRAATQRSQAKPPASIPTPKELAQQAAHIAHERYKWEKFRCTVDLMKAPLLQQLKEYEKNPEKHPLYSEEWKKFWNRRYKELQAEKKDPSKHNFKPEWIEYWTKRMKELHDEEVERKKLEIRTKMNLPAEEEERTDELREQYTLRVPPSRPKERKVTLGGSLDSDSDADDYKGGQPLPSSRGRKRASSPMKLERSAHPWSESGKRAAISHSHRSRSPYSEDIAAHRLSRMAPTAVKRPLPAQTPPERVDYDEWAKNYYGPNKKVFVRTDFDDTSTPPTFIAVCRLLTAFEEYLGSLGPKVIDLLAKGLALEKVKANSADDLLLNDDNSMFLETVKEKLKGHLMAGTIDPPKIASIKRVVQNIASLLHEVSKREPAPKPAEEEVSRDSLAVSEISGVATPAAPTGSASGPDKVTIAAQLAKALVAQGKSDFSTEELEQLINVYQAMVEMSRERKTIITTKVYLAACSSSAGAPSARPGAAASKEVAASTGGSGAGSTSSSMMFDRNRSDPPMTTYANRRLQEMERKMTPEPNSKFRSAAMLENLSDSDLQTLLQTFKDLATDEQMHLIAYLRKLERTEPERVEKLRRYVDFETFNGPRGRGGGGGGGAAARRGPEFDPDLSDDDDDDDPDSFHDREDDAVGYDPFRTNNDRGKSPAGNRRNAARQDRSPQGSIQHGHSSGKQLQQRNSDSATGVDQNKKKILVDSDDEDDYSYDDILRAASKNVTSQPPAKDVDGTESNSNHSQRPNAGGAGGAGAGMGAISNSSNTIPIPSLADTSNLVANLMESLQKSFSDAKNNAGSQDYSNPIMTIGSLGGGKGLDGGHTDGVVGGGGALGTIPAINSFGTNINGAGAGPGGPFFQRQQQQLHPQGQVRPMMQQQPMSGAFGQQPQMQQPFGGQQQQQQQFMYQGQPFGGNMNGQQQQQAAQYGYGNYGGYY